MSLCIGKDSRKGDPRKTVAALNGIVGAFSKVRKGTVTGQDFVEFLCLNTFRKYVGKIQIN
jgi:hypothetical protein